ncbi:MAG: ATP-binding protein [Chitinophagales bacterium]
MKKPRIYINWSSGKDCCYALHLLQQQGQFEIAGLLTTVAAEHGRISMHGVRETLLDEQAAALGLPLKKVYLPRDYNMQVYEAAMQKTIDEYKQEGCTHAMFGDIFLEDLRQYRETKLKEQEITCVFPLWKMDTKALLEKVFGSGIKALVVCADALLLEKEFAGVELDNKFKSALPGNVDACGENGEFHTFVFDGPMFTKPVSFTKGEITLRTYPNQHGTEPPEYKFWYCDLLPAK